jgi:prephenate dehydrogenase
MADKMQITIIGLGMIGASAGLALRRYQDKIAVVGHDPSPDRAGKAKQMGAVDRTEWNLINAVRKADRVLLALSAGEIRDTLEVIGSELKPGCVLLDTADVKVPVLGWAAQYLPDNVHFVGGHPIVVTENVGPEGARADLFDKKQFCLIPAPGTSEQAFNLAIDLVHALGAQPFFLDAVEHDGMAAMVDHVPLVVAGALMAIANGSPSWKDMRKLAGSQFYSSTWVAQSTPGAAAGTCLANREQAVRLIDALIEELDTWREQLVAGTSEALEKKFETGMAATTAWVQAHAQGNWEEALPMSDVPTSGSYLRQMAFGGIGRERGKPKR